MTRGILRDENSVILANSEHGSGEFWKNLLLMENSGCLCGIWMLVRILLLATLCLDLFWSNLVSPVDAPPSFPGTLSEIRVHEKTHLETLRRERVKWDEMIHVMSCVSMSCHVMACRRGWFLAWPPCHIWQWEFAGTFSRRHRWVFVGPCHLCVHGHITINCSLTIDSCGIIILHKTPCCTLQRPNDIQEFSRLSGISFWNLGT